MRSNTGETINTDLNTEVSIENRVEKILADPNSFLILFDGVCNLCNSSVDFIISRNAKQNIYFLTLQSELAQRLTRERNIDLEHLSSIVVLQGKASYVRSTGVLKASLHLQQPWAFLARIGLVFPAFIRDGVYRLVARSRYTFFGKKDACRLPTQQEAMQLLG